MPRWSSRLVVLSVMAPPSSSCGSGREPGAQRYSIKYRQAGRCQEWRDHEGHAKKSMKAPIMLYISIVSLFCRQPKFPIMEMYVSLPFLMNGLHRQPTLIH